MKKGVSIMAIPGLKTPDEIAAEIWDFPVGLLNVKTRKREVVDARLTLMCYRNRNLKLSQKQSAAKYGLSHNATIHACKKVDELLGTDKDFTSKYELFKQKVR